MGIETKNAIITSAEITNDDHGLLTAYLTLDYGGAGQSFGGYALYLPRHFKYAQHSPNVAGHFIWRVLEVVGVARWDQLKGKTIRVKADYSKVHEIGHIVNENWFNPTDEFEVMREQTEP